MKRTILTLACLLMPVVGFAHTNVDVTLTAYYHYSYPTPTASGKQPRSGMIAISRDLEKRYGLKFGDIVFVNGMKFAVEDRMHHKWKKRIDIFIPNANQARAFGKQKGVLIIP